MPFFFAILFTLPLLFAEAIGWRYLAAFWALLFIGSGLLKLLELGF